MEILLFLVMIVMIALLLVIYVEVEKIVDNTFEIGNFLKRQEKREIKFANNLAKYMKGRK